MLATFYGGGICFTVRRLSVCRNISIDEICIPSPIIRVQHPLWHSEYARAVGCPVSGLGTIHSEQSPRTPYFDNGRGPKNGGIANPAPEPGTTRPAVGLLAVRLMADRGLLVVVAGARFGFHGTANVGEGCSCASNTRRSQGVR